MTGQEFSSFLGERGKILTRNRTGWRTAKRNVNVARAVASSLISLKREDVTPDGRTDGRTNGWTAGLTRGLVMIVILQLVRSLSECCLSSSLSLSHTHTHTHTYKLSVHVPTLTPTSPPSDTRTRVHKYRFPQPPYTQFLPMYVLRGCMPTHQAAQRGANQTGQPTVRILIKLSVTAE